MSTHDTVAPWHCSAQRQWHLDNGNDNVLCKIKHNGGNSKDVVKIRICWNWNIINGWKNKVVLTLACSVLGLFYNLAFNNWIKMYAAKWRMIMYFSPNCPLISHGYIWIYINCFWSMNNIYLLLLFSIFDTWHLTKILCSYYIFSSIVGLVSSKLSKLFPVVEFSGLNLRLERFSFWYFVSMKNMFIVISNPTTHQSYCWMWILR